MAYSLSVKLYLVHHSYRRHYRNFVQIYCLITAVTSPTPFWIKFRLCYNIEGLRGYHLCDIGLVCGMEQSAKTLLLTAVMVTLLPEYRYGNTVGDNRGEANLQNPLCKTAILLKLLPNTIRYDLYDTIY